MTDLEAMIRAVIFVSGCSEREAPEAAALVLRIALGSLPPLPRPPWYRSHGAYRQRLADRAELLAMIEQLEGSAAPVIESP